MNIRVKSRLWAEFLALYLIAPLVMAVFVPPTLMFPVLFFVTSVGLVLLHFTKGFGWHDLTHGLKAIEWRIVAGVAFVTLLIGGAIIYFIVARSVFAVSAAQPNNDGVGDYLLPNPFSFAARDRLSSFVFPAIRSTSSTTQIGIGSECRALFIGTSNVLELGCRFHDICRWFGFCLGL